MRSDNGIYVFPIFLFRRAILEAFNILMSDLETMKIYFLKNYVSPIASVLGLIEPIRCKIPQNILIVLLNSSCKIAVYLRTTFYKDTIGRLLLNIIQEWNAYRNSFYVFRNLYLVVVLEHHQINVLKH